MQYTSSTTVCKCIQQHCLQHTAATHEVGVLVWQCVAIQLQVAHTVAGSACAHHRACACGVGVTHAPTSTSLSTCGAHTCVCKQAAGTATILSICTTATTLPHTQSHTHREKESEREREWGQSATTEESLVSRPAHGVDVRLNSRMCGCSAAPAMQAATSCPQMLAVCACAWQKVVLLLMAAAAHVASRAYHCGQDFEGRSHWPPKGTSSSPDTPGGPSGVAVPGVLSSIVVATTDQCAACSWFILSRGGLGGGGC